MKQEIAVLDAAVEWKTFPVIDFSSNDTRTGEFQIKVFDLKHYIYFFHRLFPAFSDIISKFKTPVHFTPEMLTYNLIISSNLLLKTRSVFT